MDEPQVMQLMERVRRGQISRRGLLDAGLKYGISTSAIIGLMAAAPESAGAAPASQPRRQSARAANDATTFTYLRDGGWPDLDPHSAYENGAAAIIWQIYDMLIQYKGDSTTDYDPMLAESWEASSDNSTFTFKLHANVTFHDGDPCTAQSVKDSFTRFLLMDRGPVNVIARFCDDPAKIEVVDDLTVRFNLGTPQPLF